MTRNLRNKLFFLKKRKRFYECIWMPLCMWACVCGVILFFSLWLNTPASQKWKLSTMRIQTGFFRLKNFFILIYRVKIGYICTFDLLWLCFCFIFFIWSLFVVCFFVCFPLIHSFVGVIGFMHFSNRISSDGDSSQSDSGVKIEAHFLHTIKFIS